LSGAKVARLSEAMARIFAVDNANAVFCHNNASAAAAKQKSDELGDAIRAFGATIVGVQQSMTEVAKSLGETSHRLTDLAETSGGEANRAVGAAADTASHVSTTASSTEELSASIADIYRQA